MAKSKEQKRSEAQARIQIRLEGVRKNIKLCQENIKEFKKGNGDGTVTAKAALALEQDELKRLLHDAQTLQAEIDHLESLRGNQKHFVTVEVANPLEGHHE
jgi:predicted  nucleic acid-binding Zn-ribbon protein